MFAGAVAAGTSVARSAMLQSENMPSIVRLQMQAVVLYKLRQRRLGRSVLRAHEEIVGS